MRELYVVANESTDTLWVLRTIEGDRFCIPREDLTPPSFNAPSGSTKADGGDRDDEKDAEKGSAQDSATQRSDKDQPSFTVVSSAPSTSDPLLSTPLSLRPREIQARIRAGASTEELAEEMEVAASRVEPYAHPVLLERTQVAEAAKHSHPVREDGAASDTLYEILALAFASRGHALSEATWDAMREAGEPWVVRLTWQAGLQTHQAEWAFRRGTGTADTTEPRDAVAADLIDPSFAQPVRSLSPVAHGYVQDSADYAENEQYEDGQPAAHSEPGSAVPHIHPAAPHPAQPGSTNQAGSQPADSPENPDVYNTQPNLFAEGELLQPPAEGDKPRKRRRKAVTPHWEDVLLGVRTSSKRPK